MDFLKREDDDSESAGKITHSKSGLSTLPHRLSPLTHNFI